MKTKLWARDSFAAAAFTLVFVVLAYGVFSDGFQSLERYTYDLGVRARERAPSDRVAIVAIDDQAIRNLGRWPWPRTQQAQLIDVLREGGARVIGSTALYLEAEQSSAAAALQELGTQLAASPLTQQIPVEVETFGLMLDDTAKTAPAVTGIAQAYRDSQLAREYRTLMTELLGRIDGLEIELDALRATMRAMGRAGTVTMCHGPQGEPEAEVDLFVVDPTVRG